MNANTIVDLAFSTAIQIVTVWLVCLMWMLWRILTHKD